MTLGVARPQPLAEVLPDVRIQPIASRDRREPCACGGLIVILAGQPIAEVVFEHVRSTGHQLWSNATRVGL